MSKEPVITVGAITALVAAVITLAAAFGFPLTHAQTEAIIGFVAIVAPLVVAFLSRGRVTPVKTKRSRSGRRGIP